MRLAAEEKQLLKEIELIAQVQVRFSSEEKQLLKEIELIAQVPVRFPSEEKKSGINLPMTTVQNKILVYVYSYI